MELDMLACFTFGIGFILPNRPVVVCFHFIARCCVRAAEWYFRTYEETLQVFGDDEHGHVYVDMFGRVWTDAV